mgnify:CR=1 FL=1
MYISDDTINTTIDAIISARDFCGNEREAALDCLAELGVKGKDAVKAYRIANFRANARWNAYKKAAGVNPKYTF